MSHKLVRAIRRELRAAADPEKAGPMQSYMKSEMPFHGVPTPIHRKLCHVLLREHPLQGFDEWQEVILDLWRSARYREERYCAIYISRDRKHKVFRTWKTLPMWEELIVTGAWWDFVDSVCHILAELLDRNPRGVTRRMRAWSQDSNLWKRRASILCQLGRHERTDLELLYANVLANTQDREFFIRKAIGWALREYAWTDPEEIQAFVAAHGQELSPLSRREALKNIGTRSSLPAK